MTEKCKFKLKGTGPIEFHLGCDFFCDEEGALCFAPRKHTMFGTKPKTTKVTSPLEKGDHLEIDNSNFLDDKGVQQHQLLIRQLQWAMSLRRYDIAVPVMTMSGFRHAPGRGHLLRVRRICGCLSKMRHGIIWICMEEPDCSDIPKTECNWEFSVAPVRTKRFRQMHQNHWASLLSPRHALMPTCITAAR